MPCIAWGDGALSDRPNKLSDFEYFPAQGSAVSSGVVRFDESGRLLDGSYNSRPVERQGGEDHGILVQASQNRFGILLPCMRDIGVQKIYCRADGGHDDIFSWVSHAFLKDGSQVEPGVLCERLAGSQSFSVAMRLKLSWENDYRSDVTVIHDTLDIDLCSLMWSQWLFGKSLGSGAYSFFGAYTVDLAAGLIEEDPDPLPVVRHIMILQS